MKLPIFRSSSKERMPYLFELYAYLRKHSVPMMQAVKIPYAFKVGKKKRLKHIKLLGWNCYLCGTCRDHHEEISFILPGDLKPTHG